MHTTISVLREILAADHLEKLRKFQHTGSEWLEENRKKIKEEFDEAYGKYIDDRLEDLFKTVTPGQRQANISANIFRSSTSSNTGSSSARLEEEKIFKYLNPEITKKLKENNIVLFLERSKGSAQDAVFTNENDLHTRVVNFFKNYLEKAGFTLVKREHASALKECLVVCNVNIVWSIPVWYGQDIESYDWKAIYKLIQLGYYEVQKRRDYIDRALFRVDENDDAVIDDYDGRIAKYLSEVKKLISFGDRDDTFFNTCISAYSKELSDWYKDQKKDGTAPDYFLNLKRPESLKNVGV